MGGTSKNRTQANIQLVYGQDDDLIEWLGNIPKGGRNTALKQVLRCGLELPQPDGAKDEISQLKTELATLKGAVEHTPQGGDRVQRIEEELMNIGQWINHFQARLETLLTQSAGQTIQQPVIESTPEMSDDEKRQRKSKLKKATW
jgi:hypothetical protein